MPADVEVRRKKRPSVVWSLAALSAVAGALSVVAFLVGIWAHDNRFIDTGGVLVFPFVICGLVSWATWMTKGGRW